MTSREILIGTSKYLPGRKVVFSFGTLTYSGSSDVDLVVIYQAVVLDNLENQSGIALGNQADWTWNGLTQQVSADQVTVREPDLVFSKTVSPSTALPGQEITFTLTVDHSAATETPAYDVLLTDEIPPGLTYVPGSLQFVSGQVPDTLDDSTAPILTAVWEEFLDSGSNTVISFRVTLDSSLRRGDRVENTASLAWTSLPEDDFIPPLSAYNPLSVERDYDPASAVDIYGLDASAIVQIPRLPETGFTPGVVSEVPSQPADYQYGDLGGIQLMIPALDISLPVLSIPQDEQGWDLTWLWQGAGWLEGTAYPTWTGNTVLTGHAYLASGLPGPFVNLGDLSWGDEIILFANGYRYSYQVRNKALVSGDDLSILGHKDQDWLTLFTCKEYSEVLGDYLYRQVVQAKLLDIQELK
ncbi:MAG: sortase [Anaerolineales bacterium]